MLYFIETKYLTLPKCLNKGLRTLASYLKVELNDLAPWVWASAFQLTYISSSLRLSYFYFLKLQMQRSLIWVWLNQYGNN